MVIVVRYFGGTLLGVPGLINAYKTVTQEALVNAAVIQKPVLVNYRMQFDYSRMNDVMRLVKQFDCAVYKQETLLFCLLEIGIPINESDRALEKLNELRGVESEKI